MRTEIAKYTVGELQVEVVRGMIDDQFIRNCYTLMVETRIGNADSRKACWEYDMAGERPPRFMGYSSDREVIERIRGELVAMAERFHG